MNEIYVIECKSGEEDWYIPVYEQECGNPILFKSREEGESAMNELSKQAAEICADVGDEPEEYRLITYRSD